MYIQLRNSIQIQQKDKKIKIIKITRIAPNTKRSENKGQQFRNCERHNSNKTEMAKQHFTRRVGEKVRAEAEAEAKAVDVVTTMAAIN